jgi:hypothetical protein
VLRVACQGPYRVHSGYWLPSAGRTFAISLLAFCTPIFSA